MLDLDTLGYSNLEGNVFCKNIFDIPLYLDQIQGSFDTELDLINRIKDILPNLIATFSVELKPFDFIELSCSLTFSVGLDDKAAIKLNPFISEIIPLKNSSGNYYDIDLIAAERYLLIGLLLTRSMRVRQFQHYIF